MDKKEAIRRIQDHMITHRIGEYPHLKLAEALNMAIKALYQPSTLKPIGDLDSVPHYRCPICFRPIVMYCDDEKPQKCYHCGQELLWENEIEVKE